jgi:hypothetical protein
MKMPLIWGALKTFLFSLFGKAFDFLPQYISKFIIDNGKRIALFLVYVGILTSITLTFLSVVHGLISPLYVPIPSIVYDVWGWVMPDNAIPCMTAVYSARIYKWAYLQNKAVVNKKLSVTTGSGA